MRQIALLVSACIALLFASTTAYAQGTCSCNMGCHTNPAQCVIGSGSGSCSAGYAPFCGNRGGCPHGGGAVSCDGTCQCVHIPGYDAGGAPTDANPTDGPVSMDVASGTDVVAHDAPASSDGTTPSDVATSSDVPSGPTDGAAAMDVSTGADVQLPPCPMGVIADGVCYTQECQYDAELGFYCSTGLRCDVIDASHAYCVPVCSGAPMCESGSYCDPAHGCTSVPTDGGSVCGAVRCPMGEVCDPTRGCVTDRCVDVSCASGLVCSNGQCVAPSSLDGGGILDGGGVPIGDGAYRWPDGAITAADGAPLGTGHATGCGCRTTGGAGHGGSLAALALVAAACANARRRRGASR